MELNPQAEQGATDLASLVAAADTVEWRQNVNGIRIADLNDIASPAPGIGAKLAELEHGAELIDVDGRGRPVLPQLSDDELMNREVGEYVGDAATDDTVVSQEPQFTVPDFMKDHPMATAPQEELMRMAFYQMFPTIVSPRMDTRASYQHAKLSQLGPIVDIGRGQKGPRKFTVMVDALPRRIDKKGQATRVKIFAPNVVGLVPA